MTNKICSCPGRGDGSLRWPCEAHPLKQNEAKSDQIIVSGAPSEEQIEKALDAISRFNQWTDNPRGAMRAALTAAGVASQPVIDEEKWSVALGDMTDRADKAETERDAALAAIERVRAEADAYAEQPDVMEPCGAVAQALRTALDGAPEPETPELFPGTNAALDRLTVRKAAPAEAFCIEHGNFHAVELGDPTCEFDRMIAKVERAAAARALEEFADQMATGFNAGTLNAERRAIKREARARAAEIREKELTK